MKLSCEYTQCNIARISYQMQNVIMSSNSCRQCCSHANEERSGLGESSCLSVNAIPNVRAPVIAQSILNLSAYLHVMLLDLDV